MAIINKTGITNGGTIEAEHVTRAIDALSGGSTDTIVATGSFSGSLTGLLTGTASFATSASRAVSASFATTASYALNAAGSSTQLKSLQFMHDTWVTASTTPVYYGNYPGVAPNASISRMGVTSPYTGTLVSASISGHMENVGGSAKLEFWIVRDGGGTPVSKSLADGVSAGFLSTDKYFDGFTYVLNPADVSPFTASFGDMLSIKMKSDLTVNGLNAHTTVTLLFR